MGFRTRILFYFPFGSLKSVINSLRYGHLKSRKKVLFQCVCKNMRSLRALFSIKPIHNLYLFLFYWIQNENSVLLSIWFIKIGYKLVEIRPPKVNNSYRWQSRLTKTQTQIGHPSWVWSLGLGRFSFRMIQKFCLCIIKFNS